jgi:myo-inositol 2-dehydrogenase / D-chiro-inositol 1-dehydrogenase
MEKSIGICVIGSGRAGMIHARNFKAGVPGAHLVAVADPSETARAAAANELGLQTTFADYQDALADDRIGAVVVVAPTVYHRDIVIAAAQAGKHILCEKPMAMNANECREMNAAADNAGVKLQIGFMRRFDSNFRDAYERIENGTIGAVNQVKSLTHGPSVPQPWMLDIKKSNGPLAEVNSHDIDTVRWFAGSDIEEVYAIGNNFRCTESADEYPDFYDTVAVLCRLGNGVQGVIDGAVSVGYGYDARTEILGSDGIILVGDLKGNTVTAHQRGGAMLGTTVKSWRNLFKDAYWSEDVAFIRAIVEDTPVEVTGHDGLQAVQVVNAGNESIRTGHPVTVGE